MPSIQQVMMTFGSTAPVSIFDLEADAGLGLANNDPVALWADQSPSANDATQSTAANKPTFKSAGGPGGTRPCVDFDGTSDCLGMTALSSGGGPFTIFCVLKPVSGASRTILGGGNPNGPQYRIGTLTPQLLKTNVVLVGAANTALSTTNFQQINVTWDGVSAFAFRLSSAADGSGTNTQTLVNGFSQVGCRANTVDEFFSGSLCMVRVYASVLTAGQITTIESEITTRWGV